MASTDTERSYYRDPPPAFPVIVDCSESVARVAADFYARGVRAVFRYYALHLQHELPTKIVTRAERDDIFDAGLSLGIAYQYHNDMIGTFTRERGEQDAVKVAEYGHDVIGQPAGTTVYFGVDNDFARPADIAAVKGYFEAINEVFARLGVRYDIGVYGSGLSCTTLGKDGLATKFWLARSTGYSGTAEFYNGKTWDLYQSMLEVPFGKQRVDTDWINVASAGPGTFNRNGPSAVSEPAEIAKNFRFVQVAEPVYQQPDQTSHRIGTLQRRENVLVLHEDRGWSTIVMGEDAARTGFCRSSALMPISHMP